MSKKIIVVSGKQFSGKDTLAKFMLEFLPDYKRIGIADAIKMEYGRRNSLTVEEIEKNKPIYREDLINLGNWGRSQNPDYWLNKIIDYEGNVIVPDIRLPHELDKFRANGAIAIRVEAPRDNRALRGNLVKEDDPTEMSLDGISDWDYVVKNDGTLDELREKAEKIVAELK